MVIWVVEWVHEVLDKVVIDVACHTFGMEPVKVEFESLHTVLLRNGVFFVALAFDRYGGIVVKMFVGFGEKAFDMVEYNLDHQIDQVVRDSCVA